MVKAPRSGEVKTRLIPPLCAEEAAQLSVCFIKDIVANVLTACESAGADCFAAYSPPGSEALLREFLPQEVRMLPPRSNKLSGIARNDMNGRPQRSVRRIRSR